MAAQAYQRLPAEKKFEREPTVSSEELTKDRLPRKEIGLGLALLILGLTFFFICFLHHRGHTREHIKEGSGWGLLTLGLLTFIPGAYCTWVAFAAWMGIMGYKYTDIPKVD